MNRRSYPTDLSKTQWERLRPLLERDPAKGGRPRKHPLREIANALFYVLRGGIAWRALPHDFPPWQSVYGHFRRGKQDGTLERIHAALRAEVRQRAGREITPSIVVLDSQSVRTTEKGGQEATTEANAWSAGRGISP